MSLTQEQQTAVDMMDSRRIGILHGAPGVGKTFTLRAIIEKAIANNQSFALAAPTGKAAKRMMESTGFSARTIHRLLEPCMTRNNIFSFNRNEKNPLVSDLIIIDEASMIDTQLMTSVMKALIMPSADPNYSRRGTKLLLVGDNYQLPSVGPGAVLRDLLASGKVPSVELMQIQRNTGDIVKACHQVKDGKPYVPSSKLDIESGCNLRHLEMNTPSAIVSCLRPVYDRMISEGFDPVWDLQVLSPVNERGDLSCKSINKILQHRLNPNPPIEKSIFRVNDKVINTRNIEAASEDRKKVLLVNGDMGQIISISGNDNNMIVRFFDPERIVKISKKKNYLRLAYCITTHRFQGSEAPVVIIPIHTSNSFMIDRCWLYTSISRGKKAVVTIGHMGAINQAISKVNSLNRKTYLKERILR